MPTVSYFPIISATMAFDPTPSVQSASPVPPISTTFAK
jgi:hypothetical protein